MNAAVLVLDVGMRPLRVESWQRAICDLFLGKVEVVEWKYQAKDRTIQGASGQWPMPSIVRVLNQFKIDRVRVKFSRLNIYTRDKFTCQFCGRRFLSRDLKELTLDHVMPRSRGGKTTWENTVAACVDCNMRKADRTPTEARMPLLHVPKKPAYLPAMSVKMDTRNLPDEWKPYWTAVLEP